VDSEWNHPSSRSRQHTLVSDAAVEHAGLSGAEHGVHRAPERDVPRAAGVLGPPEPTLGPPSGNAPRGDVPDWSSLQLLHST
jgi:hypothetical protein